MWTVTVLLEWNWLDLACGSRVKQHFIVLVTSSWFYFLHYNTVTLKWPIKKQTNKQKSNNNHNSTKQNKLTKIQNKQPEKTPQKTPIKNPKWTNQSKQTIQTTKNPPWKGKLLFWIVIGPRLNSSSFFELMNIWIFIFLTFLCVYLVEKSAQVFTEARN